MSDIITRNGSWVPDNPNRSRCTGLRAAGYYTLVLGALGTFGAVLSGLIISRWQLWGRGNLALHHLFLWPAFGLMTGMAVWRLAVGNRASRRAFRIYLSAILVTAGLMGTAGYWGGELLLNG